MPSTALRLMQAIIRAAGGERVPGTGSAGRPAPYLIPWQGQSIVVIPRR